MADTVKNKKIFELYIDEKLECVGFVEDVLVNDIIPALPDIFPKNDKDSEFFMPVTDDYIVAMTTYPSVPITSICDYNFCRDHGVLVYSPSEPRMTTVQAVILISYDVSGVVDIKSKTVYENDTDAFSAFIYHEEFLCADHGINEDMSFDNPAIMEAFSQVEQGYFAYSSDWLGCFGNVRYYSGIYPVISRSISEEPLVLDDAAYDAEGFVTESYQYGCETFDYILENDRWSGYSRGINDTATLIQYASKPIKSAADSTAERAKYSTRPESWHDHPYAQYFEDAASGFNFTMVEQVLINDETLQLQTEENSCTPAQAIEVFEKLKKLDNINIEYEKTEPDEHENDLYLYIKTQSGISIRASWREYNGCLYFRADRE